MSHMSRINFSNTGFRHLAKRMTLAAWTLFMMLVPVITLAETAAPSPVLKKAPPAWVGMAVMFILAALVISVSLLPAKRGHQD